MTKREIFYEEKLKIKRIKSLKQKIKAEHILKKISKCVTNNKILLMIIKNTKVQYVNILL